MLNCSNGLDTHVRPSERSESVVIPSERSESRDLHFGISHRERRDHREQLRSTPAPRDFNAEPGAAISPPDHQKHLGSWMERSYAPL